MMRIAGTGHRPDKLLGYSTKAEEALKSFAIDSLISLADSNLSVISGMALGWDTALARAAKELAIPLIAAVPFKGQESQWPLHSQLVFDNLLSYASHVEYVCSPGYAAWKMQARNRWMVDAGDMVLALWDGSSGGTANCVAYALQKRKPVENHWKYFAELKGVE